MDYADDDSQLRNRIRDLLERGLRQYGEGNIEGALSNWKHVLALDPEHERAQQYVQSIEEHYDMLEEETGTGASESHSPFGLGDVPQVRGRPPSEDDYGYESMEMSRDAPSPPPLSESEDGWNVADGWADDLRAPPNSSDNYDESVDLNDGSSQDEEPTRSRPSLNLDDDEFGSLDLPAADGDEPATLARRSPSEGLRPLRELGIGQLHEETTKPGGEERGTPRSPLGLPAMPLVSPPGPPRARGTRTESTDVRSGAAPSFDELELEPLEPTNALDELSARSDASIDEEQTFDKEETFDKGIPEPGRGAAPELPMIESIEDERTIDRSQRRAPTQDPNLSVALDLGGDEQESASSATLAMESKGGSRNRGIDIGLSDEELSTLDIGKSVSAADETDPAKRIARIFEQAPDDEEKGRTTFIVRRLIDTAQEFARNQNRYGAAELVEQALEVANEHAAAQRLVFEHESSIISLLIDGLGRLDELLCLNCPLTDIPPQEIDARAAFLLTRIDGTLSLEEILDVSGMEKLEALRHLSRLHRKGYLTLG